MLEAVEGSLLEILLVNINLASLSKTMCANVYCPPTRGSQQGSEFDTRELPYAENTIVGGDLNAHSRLWDSWQPEDRLGEKVEDWLVEKNFSVANDGEATRVNVGTGGRSAPDVTLVHNSWLDKVEWGVMDCMGSDHLPILITLDIPITTLKPTTSRSLRWNWSKADFEGFSNQVEMAVLVQKDSIGRASLDARMASLVVSITEAANSFIGKVKSSANGKAWMTRDLREAVKFRNSLRRTLGDNRREWVEACRSVQALIRKEKERRWVEFLEDAADTADPNKIWRVVKSLSDKSQGSTRNESLVHNGRLCTTSKAKADAFMQRYAEVSRLDIPKADRLKKSVRRQLKVPSVDGESSSPFSLTELNEAIKRMKPKGAPGGDGIEPRFLQALGPIAREYLLSIFNESWDSGKSPASWRVATIIPLVKKGKPASDIDSYRPVSLTSCVAKTMERMVASRLSWLAEENGWWNDDQAGFRAGRSCEDQVLRLSHSISNGFQCQPAKRSVLALLDFSKAYDTVWRNRLLTIMLEKGVPRRLVRWLRGFLSDRRANVRIDGVTGRSRKLHQGVPQGAVLSPLLFLFFIDGIRDEAPDGALVSMYADDIAVWASHQDKEVALRIVQEAVEAFSVWSKNHRITLNTAKCEVSFFSSSPKEASWSPSLTLNGQPFRVNKTPTFLGVTFDRTLTFRPQVEAVKSKTLGRIKNLSSLASKEWGWDRSYLTRVYKATIGSVLHYCGAAWQPWLANTNRQILERVNNRALRSITGQTSDTPIECLRTEAKALSFVVSMRRNCAIAWEKSARVHASNPRRSLHAAPVHHRWKNRSCFSDLAKEICGNIGLEDHPRDPFLYNRKPPWLWGRGKLWRVKSLLAKGGKTLRSQEALLEDSLQTIAAAGSQRVTIYTDGSAESGHSCGGSAAVVTSGSASAPIHITTRTQKGSRWTSSFETEVAALNLAIKWLAEEDGRFDPVMVCSDSQSLMLALEGSGKSDKAGVAEVRRGLFSLNREVLLQWVPGHCGLIGNEWADDAANSAWSSAPTTSTSLAGRITFEAAKAIVKREVVDVEITHSRTKAVYCDTRSDEPLTRREAVLLAQLRSGYCRSLAAYRNIIDANSTAMCPYCEEEFETLEHWLQECPATRRRRIRCFGGAAPPLSVLVSAPRAVLAFCRGVISA